MKLKVAAWNMDSWKRTIEQRKAAWAYLTETIAPDIALLQEFVLPAGDSGDYHILYHEIGGGSRWGTALVTKELPVREVELSFCHPGAVVAGDITLPNGAVITAISLYGLFDSEGYVTATLHRTLSDLTPLLNKQKNKRLFIVGGDYNTSTQYDEQYKNRYPSHRIFFDRLEDFGLVNCTMENFKRHVQTHRHAKSSYPWQNDYIHASKKLYQQLKTCEIIDNSEVCKLSDHNPVVGIFYVEC